jgi:hypothetical protein
MKLDRASQRMKDFTDPFYTSIFSRSPKHKFDKDERAWLNPDEPSSEGFELGDTGRFLTRAEIWEYRIPHVKTLESRIDFLTAQPYWIRSRVDELWRWKVETVEYCSSPEMQLAAAQAEMTDRLKGIQRRAAFTNHATQAARLWLDFTPEERKKLRESLSGVLECYESFKELDQAVLNNPNSIERADALAAAKSTYRKLAAGTDLYTAFAARDRCLDDRQFARETLKELDITNVAATKALAEHNGNKSAAAKALGISRAKMRRLTGERM